MTPSPEVSSSVRTQPYDVVVIGAGPAGSLAAYLLAREGVDVLLLERDVFPRAKVCGCTLSPRAMRALDRAGLAALVAAPRAAPLSTLELRVGRRSHALPLPGGVAISRAALDAGLADAARAAGATFVDGVAATRLEPDGGFERVALATTRSDVPERVLARALIAAGGLRDGVMRAETRIAAGARVGAGAIVAGDTFDLPHGVVRMIADPGGYVGLARVESGEIAVAAALDAAVARSTHGPPATIAAILTRGDCVPRRDLGAAPWKATPPLTRSVARTADRRCFAAGDAAGYVEPFTGEGIGWALNGAFVAARSALDLLAGAPEDTAAATHRRALDAAVDRRLCHGVRWLARRPRILGACAAALSRALPLARPLLEWR